MSRGVHICAALVLLGLAAAGCAVWMPGESFQGEPPPLTREQEALASRLRAHVVMLAETIGERNLAHYDGLERARDYIERQLVWTTGAWHAWWKGSPTPLPSSRRTIPEPRCLHRTRTPREMTP